MGADSLVANAVHTTPSPPVREAPRMAGLQDRCGRPDIRPVTQHQGRSC